MRLRALHTAGVLDISSQEQLHVYNEMEPFRLALRPGQVVEVEDHWRKLKNIHNAINAGLLEVIEYNYSNVGEEVTHAELEERLAGVGGGGIGLEDLSVVQLPNSGTGELTYDNVTGVFTYTPPVIDGSGGGNGWANLDLEMTILPLETPDDINRTFTLPLNHIFESESITLTLNGQTLPKDDILENTGNQSVTLHPDVSTPKTDDIVTLTYLRSVYPIGTGEYPQETPDGINKTFTLYGGDAFVEDKVAMLINGIVVSPDQIIKAVDGTSVTLASSHPAPEVDDVVTLMYSRTVGYSVEINLYSIEQPNGSHRTFTLPNSNTYVSGKVELLINGQRLPKEDFIENGAVDTLTLHPDVSTPLTGDSATLIYMKPA